MKKIFYAIAIVIAGVFATSCIQEHIEAQIVPEAIITQGLGQIQGCTLSDDGDPITTTYSEVYFGVEVPYTYTLWMDLAGNNFANAKKVDANIYDGTISFAQKKFNKNLLNMGVPAGTEVTVQFRLDANLMNEKSVSVDAYCQHSGIVEADFVTYEEQKGEMPVVDVPGDYQGWAPSDYPKLFNYSYDEVIYRGVVDFQCKKPEGSAANGFKITGEGNWDSGSGNWGSEAQAEPAEAASVQLINGDASQNIICYGQKRYYLFEFDKDNLTLTKLMSFDQVGIIGLNGDWDNDVVMTYNMFYGRFWVDVDLSADTEFKFRLDAAWDNNWGGDLEDLKPGADNIPIAAGQYRIYFYMNDTTLYAELDESMYGKEEPTVGPTPVPVPAYQGWGLIGDFNEWATDVEMSETAGVWTGYIAVDADQGWKLRKDADWVENRGGVFGALDVPFEAVPGGDNISLPAGFYKVEYDSANETITVSDGHVWSLIGGFNEWGGDVDMTLVNGVWVSPAVALSGEWKIRENHAWDNDRGGVFEAYDVPFEAVPGGSNINCGEGEFIVTYDPANETLLITQAFPSNIWSVIGDFAASGWANDIKMTYQEGADFSFWVSDPIDFKGGESFKVRYNRDWGVNRGADVALSHGVVAKVSQDGNNLSVAADGTYCVVYCPEREEVFFLGWSLIGDLYGSGWGMDFPMSPMDVAGETIWTSATFQYNEGEGFKARCNASWDVNRGGRFEDFCMPFPVFNNGDNITLPESGYYYAAFNESTDMMTISRADWSIIGDFNSWGGDEILHEIEKGVYSGSLSLEAESQVKLRKDRDWTVNRGGVMVEFGTPFAVEQDGANIVLPAGDYIFTYDSNAEALTIISY